MNTPVVPLSATPATNTRRWCVLLAVCIVLVVGTGTAWHFWLAWQERHLVRQARVYLQLNDLRSFSRKLSEARRLDPNNVETCRLYAYALAQRGDSGALPWFRLAAQLTNGGLSDELALAKAAFGFGQSLEAAKVLRSIESKAQGYADYHALAGRLAQSSGDFTKAESEYAEAVQLAPSSDVYRLQLATARLESKDLLIRAKAQSELEELQKQPKLSSMALRALIGDALRQKRTDQAIAMAERLDALPDRPFSDRLTYLEVLREVEDPAFASRLAETQEDAGKAWDKILPLLAACRT